MLAANKSVYESSIDKLKQQHDAEMKMKMRMVEDLKSDIDGLKEKEGMKFVSEQTLIKQCDQYSSEMNDLQERVEFLTQLFLIFSFFFDSNDFLLCGFAAQLFGIGTKDPQQSAKDCNPAQTRTPQETSESRHFCRSLSRPGPAFGRA